MRRRRVLAGGVALLVALSSGAGLIRQLNDRPDAQAQVSADSAPGSGEPTRPSGDGSAGAMLPTGPAGGVVTHGKGTFTAYPLAGSPATSGRPVTIGLDIEDGIVTDTSAVRRDISSALLDSRGWQAVDHVHFVMLDPQERSRGKKPEIIVTLASPDTVNKLCAPLETHGNVSCAKSGRAVINLRRWMLGVPFYDGDLAGYREYVVNHEVGHTLGHDHQSCPRKGRPAPVMLQQTLGLQGCTPWPWPKQP